MRLWRGLHQWSADPEGVVLQSWSWRTCTVDATMNISGSEKGKRTRLPPSNVSGALSVCCNTLGVTSNWSFTVRLLATSHWGLWFWVLHQCMWVSFCAWLTGNLAASHDSHDAKSLLNCSASNLTYFEQPAGCQGTLQSLPIQGIEAHKSTKGWKAEALGRSDVSQITHHFEWCHNSTFSGYQQLFRSISWNRGAGLDSNLQRA